MTIGGMYNIEGNSHKRGSKGGGEGAGADCMSLGQGGRADCVKRGLGRSDRS